MKESKGRFRELLTMIRTWDNFNFKEYRKYLDAKARWITKMN